jgi:hypothetical protein
MSWFSDFVDSLRDAFSGGDRDDGGSDRAPTTSPRPTPRPTPPPSFADDDDDDGGVYQGPMITGGPGYTQDISQQTVDRDTGFITEDRGAQDIAPPPPPPPAATYVGPMPDGTAGYTQDTSLMDVDEDTGFITEDRGAPDTGYTPRTDLVVPSTGIETLLPPPPPPPVFVPPRVVDEFSGLPPFMTDPMYISPAGPTDAARAPALPTTPAPVNFIPSLDLRDTSGSLLPPARGTTGPGQVDPRFTASTTSRGDFFEQMYGYDPVTATADQVAAMPVQELSDFLLATGRTQEAGALLAGRPESVLPVDSRGTFGVTGQVPAGTAGAAPLQDIYMAGDVGLTNVPVTTTFAQVPGGLPPLRGEVTPGGGITELAPAFTADQIAAIRGAETIRVPGGTQVVQTGRTPAAPAIDLGLTPVDVATPVTIVSGGGGGTPGGGSGTGILQNIGAVSEEVTPSRGSPAGIEGLLERSPTLGQPAATTVPQASDIIVPGVETSPTVTREPPPPLAPPGGEETPTVDITPAPRDEVGGDTEAEEDVEVTVDTGAGSQIGVDEDTGTGREEEGGAPGGTGGEGTGEGVEVDIGAGEGEGTGTGGEGGGEGTGTGTGTGAGEGEGTGTGTGGGTGAGTGTGTGDGTGEDGGETEEVDTEVVIEEEMDEDEEPPVEEEEEPGFECPPGFRRVQMANGGFTCVPEMVRPRVGPYTGTVDVSGLQGRTVFRPGTRRG